MPIAFNNNELKHAQGFQGFQPNIPIQDNLPIQDVQQPFVEREQLPTKKEQTQNKFDEMIGPYWSGNQFRERYGNKFGKDKSGNDVTPK